MTTSKRLLAFLFVLAIATTARATTYNCSINPEDPTKDAPQCMNTASCNGENWRWSDRKNCEITCMESSGSGGEMIDVGSATCQIGNTDGEPDCGGWPCI